MDKKPVEFQINSSPRHFLAILAILFDSNPSPLAII